MQLLCFLCIAKTNYYIYIYAFSRRFYPKWLTVHSGYTFIFVSTCSLGIEPTTFALLTQCSTTEPQEHLVIMLIMSFWRGRRRGVIWLGGPPRALTQFEHLFMQVVYHSPFQLHLEPKSPAFLLHHHAELRIDTMIQTTTAHKNFLHVQLSGGQHKESS